jgi:hypothetical protein
VVISKIFIIFGSYNSDLRLENEKYNDKVSTHTIAYSGKFHRFGADIYARRASEQDKERAQEQPTEGIYRVRFGHWRTLQPLRHSAIV